MHPVIAFEMNFAEIVLVEEVVGDDQSLVVVGQGDVVRTRANA